MTYTPTEWTPSLDMIATAARAIAEADPDNAARAVLVAVGPGIAAQAWREGYSHLFDAGREGSERDVSLNDNPYREQVAREAGRA